MKKATIIIGIILIALILLAGSFSGGVVIGRYLLPAHTQAVSQQVENTQQTKETGELSTQEQTGELPKEHPTNSPKIELGGSNNTKDLFSPFWEVWDIVHDQYVDQPIDDVKMMRGAIRGMLESLGDQHTSYMDPDQYLQANIPLEGEYEGIGAWVDPNAEYLTIVSPMPGSPAEKAGLQPGDEIIAVDGDDVTGIDGNLVIRRVLGPAGSKVILTIRREGINKPFDVEITRENISIPSVEYHMLDNNIGYIQLLTFGSDTKQELHDAIKDLMKNHPAGLVFDLRNNGGGYLTTAVDVASEFIDKGVILYEQYGDGHKDQYDAKRGGLAKDIPLVVLINEGTASASEIVAGAIQDHERAPLIGVKSYGKGSVQNWIPLSNDQGAVRVTIARWLTPNGRTINQIGLEPDYYIAVFTPKMIEQGITPEEEGLQEGQYVILTQEDIDQKRDPQLEKAIDVLLGEK
ncbi:MAG: S41 family peptidase [Anaerolineales bacterium]|nr:S41 family peptidase [Anaerolineales bacterium]